MRLEDLVSGWMTDHPITIAPEQPVIEAYAAMVEHGIHHIPVLKEGKLVGIVSDRDLHRSAPLGGGRTFKDAEAVFKTPVAMIMTKENLLTVGPLATLAEAAKILVEANVHSLPVVDGDRLVGLITTRDLVAALLGLARARDAERPEGVGAPPEAKRRFEPRRPKRP